MLDRYLIEHCSPTLASLKTANLFSLPFDSPEQLAQHLAGWNRQLSGKGVSLLPLLQRGGKALIYVYRRERLQDDLTAPGVVRFLSAYGYPGKDAQGALEHLQRRLEQSGGFPHEIGLFLGYPLGDVIGFVQNAGKNCKCTGCWKVYCDECEALRLFAKYRKCRDIYLRLWRQGRSVLQLTVAA